MNQLKYDRLIVGLVAGFLFPIICFMTYSKYRFPDVYLLDIFNHVYKLGLSSAMISLSVFFNLAIFFLFIWKKADRAARGVLAITIAYAIVVFIFKLT